MSKNREITKADVNTIDFAIDEIDSVNSKKLLKELATLKEKLSNIIELQKIKETSW